MAWMRSRSDVACSASCAAWSAAAALASFAPAASVGEGDGLLMGEPAEGVADAPARDEARVEGDVGDPVGGIETLGVGVGVSANAVAAESASTQPERTSVTKVRTNTARERTQPRGPLQRRERCPARPQSGISFARSAEWRTMR